jgi:putative membrane protein
MWDDGGWGMWGMHGGGWWGLLVMAGLLVLVIGGAVLLAVLLARASGGSSTAPGQAPPADAGPSPADRLLDERYARGEIDEQEYLHRRAVLRGR